MDGLATVLPSSGSETVLQRFVTDRPSERRALYWRDGATEGGGLPAVTHHGGGRLEVAPGGVLAFDTYFNAFFEAPWRRHTTVRRIVLRVVLAGTGLLRVYRRALDTKVVVAERVVSSGTVRVTVAEPALNFRQNGVLVAELTATDGTLTFLSGAWLTDEPPGAEIGLAAVFCTFNREVDIARVLGSLGSDRGALDRLARVFVVNQGRPGLLHAPAVAGPAALMGDRLQLIEQANCGGAGGFSRGLLAALEDRAVTHAVLLDDDLELEPDSLLRMAAFFAFCRRDILLGGHMLDLLRPTTLYEAGAVIGDRHWNFLPQHYGEDIADPDNLETLSRPYAVHYNGWWCCGIPLALLRQHGMPLPCFIRGDDMELGLRLHARGVPTVPMPGIAVWHEPFYLKLGGWQLYYETRNTLVATALHLPFARSAVVRRIGRQLVVHLLTYRYYSTALILRGIADFLAGPSVMRAPPLPRHESLQAVRAAHPPTATSRETVRAEMKARPIPIGRLRNFLLIGWLLLRNALAAPRDSAARILPVEELHWFAVRDAEHFATETWWDDELPTYRRCRDQHRALLFPAVRLLLRLFREAPAAADAWRAAAPELTSVPFWQDYLGVAPAPVSPVPSTRMAAQAAP